jgi:AAA-like domain
MNKHTAIMKVEEAVEIVDAILTQDRLSSIQDLVFRDCWNGKTYQEIAQNCGYDGDYIRIVGSRLWQMLSNATGEKISKSNIHVVLRRYSSNDSIGAATSPVLKKVDRSQVSNIVLPEFPGGTRPLNCNYYVEYPSIAQECYREIAKPGALIRIKAPEKRGKSSLMLRILAHAESQGYKTVRLNLHQVEEETLNNLDRFLRWFCANIAQQLELESQLDDYWDADLGSKISCTSYLQGHILAQLDCPLVIALDEVHRLFEHPEVAQDFLPLLRLWHEEANNLDAWTKLRLIVVYSTEVYIPLDLNQSPCNVGLPILLPKFDLDRTQNLALRYGLKMTEEDSLQNLISLQAMVDGHPYLLSLAFYHLASSTILIKDLLNNAPTQTSMYSKHLRCHLIMLQNHSTLSKAFKKVVMADTPIHLDAILAYQLESMGLVNLDGDMVTPSCDLYRLYFRDRLT